MSKIPLFLLGGAIPTAQVGAVLEAMYLAGGTQFSIKPLVPQKRNHKALPSPNGGTSKRQMVLAFALTHKRFTLQELRAVVPDRRGNQGLYQGLDALKRKGLIRATLKRGKATYVLTAKGVKHGTRSEG